jgi:cell division septation protein DedD
VASPETVDPERVIIRNPDNGNFVIGALFRRERLNPGPTLQISSDAAAALGILAGAPTRIEVVALRRSEPEATAAAEETAPADVTAEAEDAAPQSGGEDIGAAAVAALEGTAATGEAAADAPETGGPAETGAIPDDETGGTDMAALPAPTAAAEPPPRKKRKWFWQKNRTDEPLPASLPADEADAAEAAGTAAVAAIATSAIAATALPDPDRTAAAEPAAAAAVASAAAAAGGRLIQIGFFSVEENAQRTVDRLGASGIPARVLTEQAKGKTFWRVVAGPGADAGLLGKVKSAGFADAYFVNG